MAVNHPNPRAQPEGKAWFTAIKLKARSYNVITNIFPTIGCQNALHPVTMPRGQ